MAYIRLASTNESVLAQIDTTDVKMLDISEKIIQSMGIDISSMTAQDKADEVLRILVDYAVSRAKQYHVDSTIRDQAEIANVEAEDISWE